MVLMLQVIKREQEKEYKSLQKWIESSSKEPMSESYNEIKSAYYETDRVRERERDQKTEIIRLIKKIP